MDDGVDAFFINPHTKGIGTDHHVELMIFKFIKQVLFLCIVQFRMVRCRDESLFGKVVRVFLAALTTAQIDNRHASLRVLRIGICIPCLTRFNDLINHGLSVAGIDLMKVRGDVLAPDFHVRKRRAILYQGFVAR